MIRSEAQGYEFKVKSELPCLSRFVTVNLRKIIYIIRIGLQMLATTSALIETI